MRQEGKEDERNGKMGVHYRGHCFSTAFKPFIELRYETARKAHKTFRHRE